MSPVAIAVTLVAAQRLSELVFAAYNTRALRARGAVEHGAGHYPLIVALHVAWLGALLWLVPPTKMPNAWLIGAYLALQPVRLWGIWCLGRYWTTRVLTVADAPLTTRGPYRLMRHPLYAVVICEIALLPLAFGAWRMAIAFSLMNGVLLARRISVEERAIAPRRA